MHQSAQPSGKPLLVEQYAGEANQSDINNSGMRGNLQKLTVTSSGLLVHFERAVSIRCFLPKVFFEWKRRRDHVGSGRSFLSWGTCHKRIFSPNSAFCFECPTSKQRAR
jgi:hypothetical protein